MKHIIKIFIILSTLLLSYPSMVKAESFAVDARVEILPDGASLVPYLNEQSTGFRVNLNLPSAYTTESLSLYLGDCAGSIDIEAFDNGLSYYLSSGTATNSDLKSILQSCSGFEEGSHHLVVKGFDGTTFTELYSTDLIADFSLGLGSFLTDGNSGKIYKIGESFNIIYQPPVDEDLQVSAVMDGNPVELIKIGGQYVYRYTISEGDKDRASSIALDEISIRDLAGNIVEIAQANIPIDFTIDAQPPIIFTPFEEKAYATGNLEIPVEISDYESVSFYLNDQSIDSLNLSNLTTGNYVVKIVATDLAGNVKIKLINFSVDLVGPSIDAGATPTSLEVGESLKVEGSSEPFSKVWLYINGQRREITTNELGEFTFNIDDLAAGDYHLILESSDGLGNISSLDLGMITMKAKVTQAEINISQEPIKVAKAAQSYYADSTPRIEDEVTQDETIAKAGKIVTSTDRRQQPKNFTPWLILVGLLVFSFAVSSASYYGLSWLGIGRAAAEDIPSSTEINTDKSPVVSNGQTLIADNPEEEERHLRW